MRETVVKLNRDYISASPLRDNLPYCDGDGIMWYPVGHNASADFSLGFDSLGNLWKKIVCEDYDTLEEGSTTPKIVTKHVQLHSLDGVYLGHH